MSYKKQGARRSCQERREELSLRLKSMATWDMNYSDLSKEFGVSRQMIGKDVKKCLSEVHREDLLEISHNVKRTIEEAVLVARRLLRSNDDNIRARGVHAAVEAASAYLRVMNGVLESDVSSAKPTVQQLNDFLNLKSRSIQFVVTEKTHTMGPSRLTLPPAQDSPTEVDDDLVAVKPGDDLNEEEKL